MDVCRLCSSDNNVIDVFHSQLQCRDSLRRCIFMATGIKIEKEDSISTMVCYRCCALTVNLQKYRINAIKNDKMLKQKCGQKYEPPTLNLDELSKAALNINLSDVIDFERQLTLFEYHTRQHSDDLNAVKLNVSGYSSTGNKTKRIIKKHPSVQKLLSENKSLILPIEVYRDDVAPSVTLDTTELDEWYAKHSSIDNSEYVEPERPVSEASSENDDDFYEPDSPFVPSENSSDTNSDSSSDSEEPVLSARLRKRSKRRIILDSDSEDEHPKKTRTLTTAPEKAPTQEKANCQENSSVSANSASVPPNLDINVSMETNLQQLFSEFNKYGINIENSEPPIEMGDSTTNVNEDAISLSKYQDIFNATLNTLDHEDKESPIVVDDDVICLSDDNTEPESMDAEVKLLFQKHYKSNCKPKVAAVYHKQKGFILLRNMLHELKKYYVPVELEKSDKYQVKFLFNNTATLKHPKNFNFWKYEDCMNIQAVARPTKTNEVTNDNRNLTNWEGCSAPVAIVTYSASGNSVMQPILLSTDSQPINPIGITNTLNNQNDDTVVCIDDDDDELLPPLVPIQPSSLAKPQKTNPAVSTTFNVNVNNSPGTLPPLVMVVKQTAPIALKPVTNLKAANTNSLESSQTPSASSRSKSQATQEGSPPTNPSLLCKYLLATPQAQQPQSSNSQVGVIRVKKLSELLS